jgi:hypothetical protein
MVVDLQESGEVAIRRHDTDHFARKKFAVSA